MWYIYYAEDVPYVHTKSINYRFQFHGLMWGIETPRLHNENGPFN